MGVNIVFVLHVLGVVVVEIVLMLGEESAWDPVDLARVLLVLAWISPSRIAR